MRRSPVIGQTQGGSARQRPGNRQTPVGSSLPTRRQKLGKGRGLAGVLAIGLLLGGLAAPAAASAEEDVRLELTPSSTQLAQCMPGAKLEVTVRLLTEKVGFDASTSVPVTCPLTETSRSSCLSRPGHHSARPSTSVTSVPMRAATPTTPSI
jgi:hypothetical protein